MKSTKILAKQDQTILGIVFFFTLIGFAIRFIHAIQSDFPLNDGGLFYVMAANLKEAKYILPLFTNYNLAEIPYTYPPLAFYLTGVLSDLFNIPLLTLVRLLPPIVSALAIPAFYLLAKDLTDSKLQVVFSLLAFTLLPRVFAWHIMGGGITRAPGFLFAILTMTFTYRFFIEYSKRYLLYTILFGALTVVTHPEATVHTAITALVFYLWKDRSLKGLLLSLSIAAGILALTFPWWGLVLSRHGIDPFLASINAAGQDSFNPLVGIFVFFGFMFTDEAFLPLLAMLGLLGLFFRLAKKELFLPAWMFAIHLIEPRGGTQFMMLPLSLLVGYSLTEVILPALQILQDRSSVTESLQHKLEALLSGKGTRLFLLFLFAYCMMSAYSTIQKVKDNYSLQPEDLESFRWVKENTPKKSEFILITSQLPLRDAWSEWFPVITERRSQASVFGYEWINDGQFGRRVDAYKSLQGCAYKDVSCLETLSLESNASFSHVYLRNPNGPRQLPLSIQLENSEIFELIYEDENTLIFQKLSYH